MPADQSSVSARVVQPFDGWDLNADQRWYLAYNAPRYEMLLELCRELVEQGSLVERQCRILDVGAGFQTQLMRTEFPTVPVDTLGFGHPLFRPRDHEAHTFFDLNGAIDRDSWPAIGPYPLVVIAEVVEHLHVSAEALLGFLAAVTEPGGHVVVQTPNAAALHKRIKLLAGRHPYMALNDDPRDPMHFREYTVDEIESAAGTAGFEVVSRTTRNYFVRETLVSRAYNALSRVLPARMRHGITLVLRKPA